MRRCVAGEHGQGSPCRVLLELSRGLHRSLGGWFWKDGLRAMPAHVQQAQEHDSMSLGRKESPSEREQTCEEPIVHFRQRPGLSWASLARP